MSNSECGLVVRYCFDKALVCSLKAKDCVLIFFTFSGLASLHANPFLLFSLLLRYKHVILY